MHEHEHPTARKIVANLLQRYRRARKAANRQNATNQAEFGALTEAHAAEAWNAYVASKRILLGLAP